MSRIMRVEVGRYDYAFQGSFKFFQPGPDGVVRRPSVLLRLSDDNGFEGWGQAVPVPSWTYETVESVESSLRLYLAPALLGADPDDLPGIHARLEKALQPGLTVGQPLAKAAVDLACHDLAGKRRGLSASRLWGGTRLERLTLNWTVNAPKMEEIENQLAQGWAHGYRHFTVKVGPPQSTAYDLELVRKVKAFAPQSFMWADANTHYDLDTALEILPRLADAGLQVMESPLPPTQIRGYQALMRQGALPIYMDEGIITPELVAEYISLEMFSGITLKPARTGGLWRARQIIQLVQEHNLGLLGSGLTDPDLSLAAALHAYAWAGIEKPCALNGPQFLAESLAENRLTPKDGMLPVPDGPGLGLIMGEKAIAALSVAAER